MQNGLQTKTARWKQELKDSERKVCFSIFGGADTSLDVGEDFDPELNADMFARTWNLKKRVVNWNRMREKWVFVSGATRRRKKQRNVP